MGVSVAESLRCPFLFFMPTFNDLTDRIFGRLTVVGKSEFRRNSKIFWDCICACGNSKTVRGGDICSGKIRSCGCLQKEINIKVNTTHGYADKIREYNIWQSMKARCKNPSNSHYKNYGGRGIIVCDRWKESFVNFLTDMGMRPSDEHSIERINNDGNYEPENCKWGTEGEQQRNKTSNVWFEYNGIKMVQEEWAKKLNTDSRHIIYHLKNGRSFDWILKFLSKKRGITI